MYLKNYLDQHETVKKEMDVIKRLITSSDIAVHSKEIASHINTLAGKISMHLLMEDRYLYPGLAEHGNEQIKKMSETFQKEMGNLAEVFMSYKERYNTAPKVIQNMNSIKSDTNEVFSKIEKRIQKEETELYKFI